MEKTLDEIVKELKEALSKAKIDLDNLKDQTIHHDSLRLGIRNLLDSDELVLDHDDYRESYDDSYYTSGCEWNPDEE